MWLHTTQDPNPTFLASLSGNHQSYADRAWGLNNVQGHQLHECLGMREGQTEEKGAKGMCYSQAMNGNEGLLPVLARKIQEKHTK